MDPQEHVDNLLNAFEENGHRHYGENVSELEHALQAAQFAQAAGETDAVVLSCLLHDYGHLLHNLGEQIANQGVDAQHEELGAQALGQLFPAEIVEPIRMHVAAKRYLCWKDAAYLEGLSDSSRLSLRLQGGPMSDDEAGQFEANPHFGAAIRVRQYDDQGKVPGMKTRGLGDYRDLIADFLIQR